MVTIRDIAKRAGVSVPTVSRVLNNNPNVADELVARTNAAIEALNFRPNRSAQRLRANNSGLVGVVFSDITNPFYINVLKGIEKVLSTDGISVMISNADSDPSREAALVELVRAERASGLVIAPTREDSAAVRDAVDAGLPVVVVDRRMHGVDVDTVYADSVAGAYQAVRHLINLGHRKIGMISGPVHLSSAQDRYAGYMQAITDAGLSFDPTLLRFGDYRLESGYRYARELIDLSGPPTAIFVANNSMTIGALNAIHEAGKLIPDEIAIVGFDDFDWAISLNPPLTTVAQSATDIGEKAAELLLARIADRSVPPRVIRLDAELKVRASCGEKRLGNESRPTGSIQKRTNRSNKE